MKRVSAAYKAAMKRVIQPFSHIRVTFDVVDLTAVEDATLTIPAETQWSNGQLITNRIADKSQYITFEQDYWKVGSSLKLLPDNMSESVKDDFVSAFISGPGGKFETVPVLTMEFTIPHSVIGMTWIFDEVNNTYPTHMRVTAFALDEQIGQYEVHPNKSTYSWEQQMNGFDKLVIEFFEMNEPFNRLRIQTLMFGLIAVWNTADVYKSKHTMKIDPISSALPTAKMEWTLNNIDRKYNGDNPTGIWAYMDTRQPVKIEYGQEVDDDGTIDWFTAANYFTSGAPEMDGLHAKFKAEDLLTQMDDTFNHGLIRPEKISLYDLALEVLHDANLAKLPDGGDPWSLDDHLKTVYTFAAMPRKAHKECLQLIANAGKCALYTDIDGRIQMVLQESPKIHITDNGGMEWSDSADAFNSIEPVAGQYITFEHNSWLIGGNRLIHPDDPSEVLFTGYTSAAMSGDDGTFEVPPQILIAYSYASKSYNFSLEFGTPLPDTFRVDWFGEDGVLIDSEEVAGYNDAYWETDKTVSGVKNVVITFLKMQEPNSRARVYKIGKGRVSDYHLDYTEMKQEPEVKKIAQLSRMEMDVHSYVLRSEANEIYRDEAVEVHGERTIEVTYPLSMNQQATADGAEIVSAEFYAEFARITLRGDGTAMVIVTGDSYEDTKSLVYVPFNPTGAPCPVDNPLITNMTHAEDVGIWMGNYLQLRNSYSVDYREDWRLDINDVIYQSSMFEERFPVRVTKLVFNMPGQWGQIETRRLV